MVACPSPVSPALSAAGACWRRLAAGTALGRVLRQRYGRSLKEQALRVQTLLTSAFITGIWWLWEEPELESSKELR